MTTYNATRTIALALLLNLVLFSLSLQAQDANTPRTQPGAPASYPLSELQLEHFRPQYTSSHELAKLARRMFGRSFLVEDEGAVGSSPIENIQTIGDTLLIFDQVSRLDDLMQRLRSLDAVSKGESARDDAAAYVMHSWTPSHVSLNDAITALSSYRRALVHASNVQNMTTVNERNVLILRDTQANVTEMLTVLEQLDQPAPELLVSAMIVQGRSTASTADGPALPKALTDNLSRLVAYEHFEMLSMGFVRTSTRVGSVEVSMPADENRHYQLQLAPDSYDPKAGTLTAQIRFSGNDRREIQTRTQIPLNEYTVIGASGRDPLFVVIKLSPVGADAH